MLFLAVDSDSFVILMRILEVLPVNLGQILERIGFD